MTAPFLSNVWYMAAGSSEIGEALFRRRIAGEAAFANLDGRDFWGEKPVSLGIDQGGTRARRLVVTMLRRETEAA